MNDRHILNGLVAAITQYAEGTVDDDEVLLGEFKTVGDLQVEYEDQLKRQADLCLDLSKWLPTLGAACRPIVPGELGMILADTGGGKTAALQNLAMIALPMETLFFSLELPGSQMFERTMALHNKVPASAIEQRWLAGNKLQWFDDENLRHIHFCLSSRITTQKLERMINLYAKKVGKPAALVLVDYIGLMAAAGVSRYERMSCIAEDLKRIAKSTNTVIFCACQIHRKTQDGATPKDINLHDAKDSSSIEQSAQIVLSLNRPDLGSSEMTVKINKFTRGVPGFTVQCQYIGEKLWIRETPSTKQASLPYSQ